MPYAVLAAALVALDQLVKYLVSHNIPLGGHVPFLPHLVELTYFQNTGPKHTIFLLQFGQISIFFQRFKILSRTFALRLNDEKTAQAML